MAIVETHQLVQVYSRNYANTQTGWDTEMHTQVLQAPSGGVAIAPFVSFGSGLGNGYELLAGVERSADDEFTFYIKRKQGDTYYMYVRMTYDDGN